MVINVSLEKNLKNKNPLGFKRRFKLYRLKLVRLQDSPKNIARGIALGLFIGMTPTMGFQMPLAFAAAALLKENKVSSVLGVWITNPLTFLTIYFFNYKVGAFVLGMEATLPKESFSTLSFSQLLKTGMHIILPLCVGGTVTGILSGIAGYFITLQMVKTYRTNRIMLKEKLRKERQIITAKLVHEKEIISTKLTHEKEIIMKKLHRKGPKS